MKVIRLPQKMQKTAMEWLRQKKKVGFVPTMGALHEGHLSLIRKACRENEKVVVSVFVNPTQFGPKEDFSQYPRPFEQDQKLCRESGVDVLFYPTKNDLFSSGYDTWVEGTNLSKLLCGAFRPGHFRGVATVVAKLLMIVFPTRAYFGQKDFQQYRLIQNMVQDLHIPCRVVSCPIIREKDGLALSSRNRYLTEQERKKVLLIPLALRKAEEVIKSSPRVTSRVVIHQIQNILRKIPGSVVDYVSVVNPKTLSSLKIIRKEALVALSVRVGKARLIDNVYIKKRE